MITNDHLLFYVCFTPVCSNCFGDRVVHFTKADKDQTEESHYITFFFKFYFTS